MRDILLAQAILAATPNYGVKLQCQMAHFMGECLAYSISVRDVERNLQRAAGRSTNPQDSIWIAQN